MSGVADRSRASFVALLMLVTASWVLILAETYVFFVIVRPLGPALHTGDIPSSVAKIVLTTGLVILLVLAMLGMSKLYLRIFGTPRSSS